jgi:hypothetical protein
MMLPKSHGFCYITGEVVDRRAEDQPATRLLGGSAPAGINERDQIWFAGEQWPAQR